MPRPKQRTPQLRDHVVSVAVGLLAREGVAGFTARSVAREAHTSTPAVYELFGDKGGLVREVFFEGFRMLRRHLDGIAPGGDPRAELLEVAGVFRVFVTENPVLAQVMFSRPFTDFDPDPSERAASGSIRVFVVARVQRCLDTGILEGDATDIAHVVLALVLGLAAAETARRLGTNRASVDRRWDLALRAVLDGLGPAAPA